MHQFINLPFTAISAVAGAASTNVAVGLSPDAPSLSGYLGIEFFDEVEFQIVNNAATGGGGTPTLDMTLQGSLDGVNWFTVKAAVQITSTSAAASTPLAIQRDIATTGAVFGRYHRLRFTATTASGTETWSGTVYMIYRSLGE